MDFHSVQVDQIDTGMGTPLQRSFSNSLHQFSSVVQSYPTLCNPVGCCTLGLPVHHQQPEFTQTRVH